MAASNPKVISVHRHDTDPLKADLKLEEFTLAKLVDDEVLVKILAAPVNPADRMCIQGQYARIPAPPFVLGLEGVGEVLEVGSKVTSVRSGDWVLPDKTNPGTWRTQGVYKESELIKLNNKSMGFKAAASMYINPCTSYFLLTDCRNLLSGDTIIQNGANSAVGLGVIQMAKSMGFRTINVVRNRKNLDELVTKMKKLGADVVITDEDLKKRNADDAWEGGVKRPVLAIDCVCGDGAAELLRNLDAGGTLVNYGALTAPSLTAGVGDLIFRQITVKGFWLPKASQHKSVAIAYIEKLLAAGKFEFPEYELFAMKDFKAAIKSSMAGYTNTKPLLVMDNSLL